MPVTNLIKNDLTLYISHLVPLGGSALPPADPLLCVLACLPRDSLDTFRSEAAAAARRSRVEPNLRSSAFSLKPKTTITQKCKLSQNKVAELTHLKTIKHDNGRLL